MSTGSSLQKTIPRYAPWHFGDWTTRQMATAKIHTYTPDPIHANEQTHSLGRMYRYLPGTSSQLLAFQTACSSCFSLRARARDPVCSYRARKNEILWSTSYDASRCGHLKQQTSHHTFGGHGVVLQAARGEEQKCESGGVTKLPVHRLYAS